MKCGVGVGVLVAGLGVACSGGTLRPEAAGELISTLEGFQRAAYVRMETGVPLQSTFGCLSQAEIDRTPLSRFIEKQGWIRYDSGETVIGFGTKATCPVVALTTAGESASTQWLRGRAVSPEGAVWHVPIGRRELVAVTNLQSAPDGSTEVEFDWKWSPNETGAALRTSVPEADAFFETTRKSRASCRLNREWRCALAMWATPADAFGEFSG